MYIHPIAAPICASPTMPGRRRPGRRIILDVMRQLLRDHSLDALTMEQVAQQARLTRRTIYNHFASITDLFAASRKLLLSELSLHVPGCIATALPVHAALGRFAHQAGRLFADDRHHDLLRSVMRDGGAHPWLTIAYEQQIMAPISEALVAYLADPAHQGRFGPTPHRAAFQLIWTLQGAAASSTFFGANDAVPDSLAIVRAFLIQHEVAA